MCGAYSDTLDELDAYEADIINIKNLCDPKFYDYNKKFNAKAVELLRERQVEVTWSFPAHDIISLITSAFSVTF